MLTYTLLNNYPLFKLYLYFLGFFITMLQKLADDLNFEYELFLCPGCPWGVNTDQEEARDSLINAVITKKVIPDI